MEQMESSTEIGSAAEVAARLERATRSVLASSSLASYSHSQASSTGGHIPQPPTLEDLLPTLGPPDAVRCPACNAALPFGPRSRVCLACTAPLQQFTTPPFTSTLAYRCFSEALHLDGLETNFGEAEEDRSSNTEVEYVATKSSSSLSSQPLQVGGAQKILQSADISLDDGKSRLQPEPVKSDVQTPLPGSRERGSKPSAVPHMGLTNADGEEKRPGILEYSTKLEGISLDDFFSNETKAQGPQASSSDTISDSFFGGAIDGEMSGISVTQDSLFWDPLSESIILDGFDLVANSRETSASKDGFCHNVFGEEDNDDPFSSWEVDFQSATPAMANVIPGSPLSALPFTSTKIGDIFGDFPSVSSGGESLGIQGKNSWVSNGNLFDLDLDVEKTPRTDSKKNNTDVDDFFGSGWQQSMPGAASSAANDSQSLSFTDRQSMLFKSRQDLLGIMKEMDTCPVNNSLDPSGEGTLAEDLGLGMSVSAGNRNKVVGSLLAQLPDLSFMLSDKLVIRSGGKSTQPRSSS